MTQSQKLQALAQLGETHRLMQEYELALKIFEEVIIQDDKYAWAYAHRGAVKRELLKYNPAKDDFDKAISLSGGEEQSQYSWAFAQRGELHVVRKDFPTAVDDFTKAISLSGGEEQSQYAWAFAHRGVAHLNRGEGCYDLAIKDFKKATDLNPEYAWAYAYLGQTHAQKANSTKDNALYKEAMYDLLQAFAIDSKIYIKSPQLRRHLGLLLMEAGRNRAAAISLEKALHDSPDDPFIFYKLAITNARQGKKEQAREYLDKSISLNQIYSQMALDDSDLSSI